MLDLTWYNTLNKPPFTPPAWIFSPAWIVLYITILISLIVYIRTPSWYDKRVGFIFFIIQLILNILWTPVFFVFKNILLALVVIVLLDIFVLLTIRSFYKVSKLAGAILIPYFIWILYATYLNFGYFIKN